MCGVVAAWPRLKLLGAEFIEDNRVKIRNRSLTFASWVIYQVVQVVDIENYPGYVTATDLHMELVELTRDRVDFNTDEFVAVEMDPSVRTG
ncbi:hypothetical protein E2C01_055036 [Portunus trituberculatus]|uniref:Uncharacterized protein n=1 Tax=Portunus trituberculatus TaxID=210409 RepID=A0A5B7GWJ3_PORTR|nr:hypothetical protein [Portunus trituberculatus]